MLEGGLENIFHRSPLDQSVTNRREEIPVDSLEVYPLNATMQSKPAMLVYIKVVLLCNGTSALHRLSARSLPCQSQREFNISVCNQEGRLGRVPACVANKDDSISIRLAYKLSSKSAKRDRAPCLEARSSELERARARLVSNQVTLFWR